MGDKKRTSLEQKWEEELSTVVADAVGGDNGPAGGGPAGEAATAAGGDSVSGEIERLRQEVAELRDQLQRKQAEMVNFRRRMERDRAERVESERAATLRELLPVVDDFERALASQEAGDDAYREGVDLILRALKETLARLGLERFEPTGEAFDPHLHEAVEHLETDEVAEGHIVAVYKPGYRLGDRLVRAALVTVARRPRGTDEAPETASPARR